MREIEYRGKRIDNNEWAYGDLIKDKNKYYIITRIGYIANEELDFANKYIECFAYEVIPKTIGQYTGLKDKNDTKIYEGDILHIEIIKDNQIIANGDTTVEYKDCKFGVIWGWHEDFIGLDGFCNNKFEVVTK